MMFVTCTVHVHKFDRLMNLQSEISDSLQFPTKLSWTHNAPAVDIIIISNVYILQKSYILREILKGNT